MTFSLARFSLATALVAAALGLAACKDSPPAGAAGSKSQPRPVTTSTIAAEATGFTVGSEMSARTVYVFFDAQCPHCAELWRSAKPLKSKAKFVWIPVRLLNDASLAQGATLLAAADPVAAMDEHEASMLAKRGGISAGSATDSKKDVITKNTALFNQFGFSSIPTIIATHAKSGAVVTQEGALGTAALTNFLGL